MGSTLSHTVETECRTWRDLGTRLAWASSGIYLRAAHGRLRLAENGLEAWKEVVAKGWEGLIAKDPASVYEPGVRTRGWVKVKHKVRIGWPGEGTEYTRA